MAARRLASRIAAVREAVGLAAYAAGEWQTAIAEIRTYHRMTGRQNHLAVLADCERALGRPERAIDLFRTAERDKLGREDAIELLIVAAGARADLGQHDAAVAMLQVRELTSGDDGWAARLRYAYADALLAGGRTEEARAWFARAAEVDEDSVTDAAERLLELDGVSLDDDDDDDLDEEHDEAVTGSAGPDDADLDADDDADDDADLDADDDAELDDEDGEQDGDAHSDRVHSTFRSDDLGPDDDDSGVAYGDVDRDDDSDIATHGEAEGDDRQDRGASETRAARTAGLDLGAADDARVSDPVPAGRSGTFAAGDVDQLAEELAAVQAEDGHHDAVDDDLQAVAPATAGSSDVKADADLRGHESAGAPDVSPDADLGDPASAGPAGEPGDAPRGERDDVRGEVAGGGEPDDDHKTLLEAGFVDATGDTPGDTAAGGAQRGSGAAPA
jgi:hypothetical protein